MSKGLFIGRFQPFHLGHMHLIKKALRQVDELIIGIGYNNKNDKKRNPFSVKERIEMIDLALPAAGIDNYTIFPVPDHPSDRKWLEQLETLVPKFDIIFISDKNTFGEKWIEKCFKKKYKIIKIKALKGIDATLIREKMKKKEKWENLVPKKVFEYIKV